MISGLIKILNHMVFITKSLFQRDIFEITFFVNTIYEKTSKLNQNKKEIENKTRKTTNETNIMKTKTKYIDFNFFQ
jgi:hypothetical protein